MIGKSLLVLALSLLLATLGPNAWSAATDATPGRVWRIGLIRDGMVPLSPQFWDAMRAHGLIEGRNVFVEARHASSVEQLPALADELARLDLDVILALGTPAAQAAQRATSTTPIVFHVARDPVEAGLVASWARPGANLTGFALGLYGGKLLEILKQALPGTSRVAVPRGTTQQEMVSRAARDLQVELLEYRLAMADDVDGFFAAARRDGADAALVLDVAAFGKFIERIAEAATRHRMPAIGYTRRFADAGGLLSYSTDANWPRVASRIAAVLDGANPAELPVEKPTQFELVVNLKTAKALGVTIPKAVLFRATELIQ